MGIGFQGNDPGTDLRGVGLFGLWLLVYASSSLPHVLYEESKSSNFPYCTTLLMLCRATLRLLRENDLNVFINKSSVKQVVTVVFTVLHDEFERRWRTLSLTNRNVEAAGEISRAIDSNRCIILTTHAPDIMTM